MFWISTCWLSKHHIFLFFFSIFYNWTFYQKIILMNFFYFLKLLFYSFLSGFWSCVKSKKYGFGYGDRIRKTKCANIANLRQGRNESRSNSRRQWASKQNFNNKINNKQNKKQQKSPLPIFECLPQILYNFPIEINKKKKHIRLYICGTFYGLLEIITL